jgi:hypothetical protein
VCGSRLSVGLGYRATNIGGQPDGARTTHTRTLRVARYPHGHMILFLIQLAEDIEIEPIKCRGDKK